MWLRIALIVAGAFIVTALVYAWYDRNVAVRTIRQHLCNLKQRHELPVIYREVNIETVDLTQFDAELLGSVQFRQDVASFLIASPFLWVPFVLVSCVGVAWVVRLLIKFV